MSVIKDKTLVAWVCIDGLDQKGGSVLTLDDLDGRFDAIVFGEIAPRRWMPGSDHLRRTHRDQSSWPEETVGPDTLVQVAVTYAGSRVTVFRDTTPCAQYTIGQPQTFAADCVAVLGLRHLQATDRACFAGMIADARVYGSALTADELAELEPGAPSARDPLAWWCFADGSLADRMGRFTECMLAGGAGIESGCLRLPGNGAFMVAAPAGGLTADLMRPSTQPDGQIAAARNLRARLQADPHRPTYHFVTPEGSCYPFDPNGALFWRGAYHLCYIFQDERGHCWGHASSTDLVHWRFHPPALVPAPDDPDRGIFSGNAFVGKEGQAVMLYHGVGVGNCIATCTEDDLVSWTKLATNPIVPNPKEGDPEFGAYRSWDPHGWLEGDSYYAVFGGNPATLFKADDLAHWAFVRPLLAHDMPGVDGDEDISCPDLFALGDKHVLLCISHKKGCRYYLGRFEGERFHPESHHRMNWPGGTCFAPESLLDGKGRRIMWTWVLDRRPRSRITQLGWSGTMSLPRVLSLDPAGTLRIEPPAELSCLRLNHRRVENVKVTPEAEVPLPEVHGDCLELMIEMTPGDAAELGVKVRCSPDGEEQTAISFRPSAKRLRIDVARSSLDSEIVHQTFCMTSAENPAVTAQEAPFELGSGEPLRLRVFLDRSILEVFANGRQCVTQRIYPTRPDSLGVSLFSRGGSIAVRSLDVWDMAPANPW